MAAQFRHKVSRLPDSTGFSKLLELEQKLRAEVFKLVNSPYIELIFKINVDYSRRHFAIPPSDRDNTPEHMAFVIAWRKAKLMELDAIADGDEEVAMLSARRLRELLYGRVWG